MTSASNPTPFSVNIPDQVLDDLRFRLTQTRFPDTVDGVGWEWGMEAAALHRLVDHWRAFDWRAAERAINEHAAYQQEIDGVRLHYVHVRSRGARRIPVILTHGWPSCYTEFLPLIPLLTQEIDGVSFDVVIPSLPGYGFSARPATTGMNITRIADLWTHLMRELGYEQFVAHGSDMGSGVVERLRANHAQQVIGVHMVNVFSGYPPGEDLSAPEVEYLQRVGHHQRTGAAYAMLQGTKPHTAAVGLNDSPAGLAAWIGEKFYGWSDRHQLFETPEGMDTLCTILTIYWATQTIGSSQRLYREAFSDAGVMSTPPRHGPPMAIATLPADLLPAPREWAERWFEVAHWQAFDSGGHFPALEVPVELVRDLRTFFTALPIGHAPSSHAHN